MKFCWSTLHELEPETGRGGGCWYEGWGACCCCTSWLPLPDMAFTAPPTTSRATLLPTPKAKPWAMVLAMPDRNPPPGRQAQQ